MEKITDIWLLVAVIVILSWPWPGILAGIFGAIFYLFLLAVGPLILWFGASEDGWRVVVVIAWVIAILAASLPLRLRKDATGRVVTRQAAALGGPFFLWQAIVILSQAILGYFGYEDDDKS